MAKLVLLAWLVCGLIWLPAAQAQSQVADTNQSAALTDYLHAHRLPLVGAQVLNSASGRSVVLYGYTATEFGKSDAEAKTRSYLKDNTLAINNHIRVRPELASMKPAAPSASAQAPNEGGGEPPPDANAYSNRAQDAQQQYLNQQAQQYMNQGNSSAGLASALIPLLGLGLAIGLGGSGSSFSMGGSPGFGGGNSFGFGGGNPYGNPYNPYGNPYNPYGNPYNGYPAGPGTYGPNPYPYP